MCNIITPSEDTKILEFNQYQKFDKAPFIIYADFACILIDLFFIFISLSANFISLWLNICSNNFSSISFDMAANCILKYLDFNSLSS